MAEKVALSVLSDVLSDFRPHLTNLVINGTDKAGFDMDVIGRERRTNEMK